MKFSQDMMKQLSGLDDAQLWQAIRKIASSHGYTLPDVTPRPEDLKRVRQVLNGDAKMSYAEARRIINSYKNGGSSRG